MAGAHLPANPMPVWVPMANVDSGAMMIAFCAWYRAQAARGERLFYTMRMDQIITQVMHGAIGEPSDSEWVEDHYIPIRKVLCDGILCKRCHARRLQSIDQTEPSGFVFRWYSPLWEELYMAYRKPWLRPGVSSDAWVPADGFVYDDPAVGASHRGGVARDEYGRCLVPPERWPAIANDMGVYLVLDDLSGFSTDSDAED